MVILPDANYVISGHNDIFKLEYIDDAVNSYQYRVRIAKESVCDEYYRPRRIDYPLLVNKLSKAAKNHSQSYINLKDIEESNYPIAISIYGFGPTTTPPASSEYFGEYSIAFKIYFYKDNEIIGEYHTKTIPIP